MSDVAYVRAMVEIPLHLIGGPELSRIQQELVIFPKQVGGYETPAPIPQSEVRGNYLHVPLSWGMDYCRESGIKMVSRLSKGHPASFPTRPDPHHPRAPKGQPEFFENCRKAVKDNITIFTSAHTGTGKTATCLDQVAEIGVTSLIIVPSKDIARQWREEIVNKLGLTLDQIGMVEESECDYKGKPITVAVIHNIFMKEFEQEFYSYFGLVAWDEGHILGAPKFHESTTKFNAHKRLVFTATPERKDGCTKLITNYFGPIRVTSESTPMHCLVKVVGYFVKKKYPAAMPRARLINSLTRIEERNMEWVNLIKALYGAGRCFIGMSDRIEQLQWVYEKLHSSGVPEEHLALYTRKYTDADGKERTTTPEELEYFRNNGKIFLATFQMARMALDIPRLDSGAALSPTADAVQAIGRIARPMDGKPTPIWYVMWDQACSPLNGSFYAQLNGLKALPHVTIVKD